MHKYLIGLFLIMVGIIIDQVGENYNNSPSQSMSRIEQYSTVSYKNDTVYVVSSKSVFTKMDIKDLNILGKLNNLKVVVK